MDAALTGGAAPEEDVYSWLLASADQMMYPLLDPNPLDAEALGPGGRSRGSSISGAVIGMGSPDKALLAGAAAGAGSAIAASSAATRKASAGTSSKTKVKTEAGGGRKAVAAAARRQRGGSVVRRAPVVVGTKRPSRPGQMCLSGTGGRPESAASERKNASQSWKRA